MKSYIQGLITGAVFVFAFMVLIGASDRDTSDIGRYTFHYFSSLHRTTIFDTSTGEAYSTWWSDTPQPGWSWLWESYDYLATKAEGSKISKSKIIK